MKIAGVIFDLDGTVIESEGVWDKAFLAVLEKLGARGKDEDIIHGASLEANWRNLLGKYQIQILKTWEELGIMTYQEYEKRIAEIVLEDGFLDFLDFVKDLGAATALATSTRWETVDKIFLHLGITDCFDSIATGDEAVSQKPDPEIFLLAASKLGIEPGDCLVIENSISGVLAAKEADMKVVAIDHTGKKEKLEIADLVVSGFDKISQKEIDLL